VRERSAQLTVCDLSQQRPLLTCALTADLKRHSARFVKKLTEEPSAANPSTLRSFAHFPFNANASVIAGRNDPDDATLFNGPSNERRLPILSKHFDIQIVWVRISENG